MARLVVKCPACDYQESVISTSPNAEMPPCPRCEDFVRMADVTPPPGQITVISTSGSQESSNPEPAAPRPRPTPPPIKRRDPRDLGPEPRV